MLLWALHKLEVTVYKLRLTPQTFSHEFITPKHVKIMIHKLVYECMHVEKTWKHASSYESY